MENESAVLANSDRDIKDILLQAISDSSPQEASRVIVLGASRMLSRIWNEIQDEKTLVTVELFESIFEHVKRLHPLDKTSSLKLEKGLIMAEKIYLENKFQHKFSASLNKQFENANIENFSVCNELLINTSKTISFKFTSQESQNILERLIKLNLNHKQFSQQREKTLSSSVVDTKSKIKILVLSTKREKQLCDKPAEIDPSNLSGQTSLLAACEAFIEAKADFLRNEPLWRKELESEEAKSVPNENTISSLKNKLDWEQNWDDHWKLIWERVSKPTVTDLEFKSIVLRNSPLSFWDLGRAHPISNAAKNPIPKLIIISCNGSIKKDMLLLEEEDKKFFEEKEQLSTKARELAVKDKELPDDEKSRLKFLEELFANKIKNYKEAEIEPVINELKTYDLQNVPLILLFTKTDLRQDPNYICLPFYKGEELRKKFNAKAFLECSAKTGAGLEGCLEQADIILFHPNSEAETQEKIEKPPAQMKMSLGKSSCTVI